MQGEWTPPIFSNTMPSVTIYFDSDTHAQWFAKMASASVETRQRLQGASAGILQDSLAKAVRVDAPVAGPNINIDLDTPVAPAPAKPRRRRKKVLVCQDCGSTNDDVAETICPYAHDVYNTEEPATLCKACCSQRADDI
jgi:hypothetical protein